MRILYINHYAGSSRHGMEYRPYYLARHWARMGHEVTIVAASFSHLRIKSPQPFADMTEEVIDDVRYVWLKTPPYSGNGPRRVVNMAAFVRELYRVRDTLLQRFLPNVVIASSTYTWDIFPAHCIARKAGARLIYEVHDLWPLTPMILAGMSRWHPFIVSLQWAEDYACRNADMVISMLRSADMHLRERGMHPEKFHYIPNGVELSEWGVSDCSLSEDHRSFLDRLRKNGRFIIGYAGAHGLANGLDTLLDAAKRLAGKPVDFVLVGQGQHKARLQQKALQMRIDNVHFLEPIPKGAIPDLLGRMDGLFYAAKNHPLLYQFGISPNKLMDYMAAGKPIISSADQINEFVTDPVCGIGVKAEDADAVVDAILRLMNLPADERAQMGAAGTAYVRANHDYRLLAKKFMDLICVPR